MRIAIHNAFAGKEVAETGLSQRIHRAALNIGWEAIEIGDVAEIHAFHPDLVLALHFFTPKLSRYPTYGCMWNPPFFFEGDERYVKNILSYDAYLSSSEYVSRWIRDVLYHTPKKYFIAPFYTSCHLTPYQAPRLEQPRLLYTGTNWDGPRFKELFELLDAKSYMDVYGGRQAWNYLRHAYRGLLPFDGVSVLSALNRAGVGLCLHKEEHRHAATPSLRIFEIVASGAIAICQEHPFIKEAFGDSVLYLNPQLDYPSVVAQISGYMKWIESHPEQALAMSEKAYKIFVENYAFEILLTNIAPFHNKLIGEKGFIPRSAPMEPSHKRVQFIVRTERENVSGMDRVLDCVANQTYPSVGVIIVRDQETPELDALLRKYETRFPFEVIRCTGADSGSTPLWAGLKAVSSDYFAVLNVGDLIYPNHVSTLLRLMDKFQDCGVAYSGAICLGKSPRREESLQATARLNETNNLVCFEPFDLNKLAGLNNFIAPNSFIAKSELMRDFLEDPKLGMLEELFLFLSLALKTNFAFSYEVTSAFFDGNALDPGADSQDTPERTDARRRIQRMFWNQGFARFQTIGDPNHRPTTEMARLRATVAEQQRVLDSIYSSLSWRLMARYGDLKHKLFPSGTIRRRIYEYVLRKVKNGRLESRGSR